MAEHCMQLFTAAFLAALFLQAGADKVANRTAHLERSREHLRNSQLAGRADALLSLLTLLEVAAGALSALGAAAVLLWGGTTFAFGGAALGAVALVVAFAAERVAGDDEAAARLAVYFLVALAAIRLMG